MHSRSAQDQILDILHRIQTLLPFRRGSITSQMVTVTDAHGRSHSRGPYPVYTFKEHGRTVSKRLSDPAVEALYLEQIRRGREVRTLVGDLQRLAEALSDEAVGDTALKKRPKRRSKPTSKAAGSPNV
jgi:hypothetical protein